MAVLFEMGQCIFEKKMTVIISKEGGRNLQVGTQTKLEDSGPWKKSYRQTSDNILKIIDITLLTKVHILKARVFTVVTHRCGELDHKES